MSEQKTNVFEYLGVLDEKKERALREKISEIEFRKVDYERVYSLQVDNFREHKLIFGNEKRGILPGDYSVMLERELLAYAEELEKEQYDEIEARYIEEREKLQDELGPLRYSFQQQLEDLGKERKFEDRVEEMEKDAYEKGWDWEKDSPEMEEYYEDY